jgi:diguanylate cyclase (GGDEF)-like protein
MTVNTKQPSVFSAANVLDSIAMPAFALDATHTITHWNRAIEKASGYPASDMIGTNLQWKPFYEGPRPTMADLIVEGGRNEEIEKFYTNKYTKSDILDSAYEAEDYFPAMADGEWLSFTAAPIYGDDGKTVIGAVETLNIISDRKLAEQQLIESQQNYRELSTIDDLTQLGNSRHFFSQIKEETDRCNRYHQLFSICMLDLDDFKSINDTYGHQFGNTVLEKFAHTIKTHIRNVDMAFRYGGEEFVILFPFADSKHAAHAINKILLALTRINFSTENNQPIPITASAGLATFIKNETHENLILRADDAMYLSKKNGKNQLTIAN